MSERTLRRRAKAINYSIHKGLQHWGNSVLRDREGKGRIGYMVMNLETGFYVWGCYDSNLDFLWTLADVENFLKEKYQELGIAW